MQTNQFFKNTFFLIDQHDQNRTYSFQHPNIPRDSQNYPQFNLSKSSKPLRHLKKHQNITFSQRNSANELKNKSESFQYQKQKKQRRFLSTIDKRNLESSLQEVSPWSVSQTPRQMTTIKHNFSKQRQKIKQMIYQYRLNKTIAESSKEHANFIKSPKSKKKKINTIFLQYENDQKATQRPLSLIKSVDVNKSYENYLNNDLDLDKKLFKTPLKMNNLQKKQISSCRMHTKESQKQKDKTIKQQLTHITKEDAVCVNYLDETQINQLKKNIKRTQQQREKDKKVLQKVLMLKSQRNKKGLRNHRMLRNIGQEPMLLSSKNIIKNEKLQFSISGNKTHKLEYQLKQPRYE